MATKKSAPPSRLQALHGWHGPEGVFEPGDLVPHPDSGVQISDAREKELVDGGYVTVLTADQAQEVAAAAQTDLPGQ